MSFVQLTSIFYDLREFDGYVCLLEECACDSKSWFKSADSRVDFLPKWLSLGIMRNQIRYYDNFNLAHNFASYKSTLIKVIKIVNLANSELSFIMSWGQISGLGSDQVEERFSFERSEAIYADGTVSELLLWNW